MQDTPPTPKKANQGVTHPQAPPKQEIIIRAERVKDAVSNRQLIRRRKTTKKTREGALLKRELKPVASKNVISFARQSSIQNGNEKGQPTRVSRDVFNFAVRSRLPDISGTA
ncbi:hypothetical protein NDU88_006699 [Pleurodeles waltl]|uniref:Uncharacterized protein n=1 Tax=Pleurodeles waltl TaxID=8319 RepID=A0AAV7RQX0_PLEWA|nr:hypothetical protein NDU88_006699 [Pleurodeles waltl]